MKVSIGILAHNEEASIEIMLRSLFEQTLLSKNVGNIDNLEIIIVANGCNDSTVDVSRNTLKQLADKSSASLDWHVYDVGESGKCNAWNLYIHKFSNPESKYLFLADADIRFLNPETLYNMINLLETHKDVWVATDQPVKDISMNDKKNFREKLLLTLPSPFMRNNIPSGICGQLYCGRADILRKITMPGELPVEDGFINAMITTNFFSSSPFPHRVQQSSEASHVFEVKTNLFQIICSEKRQFVGNIINGFLFEYFWANCNEKENATFLIQKQMDLNSEWLREFIQAEIKKRGWWLIPNNLLLKRFKFLSNLPIHKAIQKLPVAMMAFILTILIAFSANQEMHKSGGLNYW